MSQLVARILLALFVVPLGLIAYFISMFFLEFRSNGGDSSQHLMIAGLITWILTAAYWLLLWWRQVKWTQIRTILTVLLAPVALLTAGIMAGILNNVEHDIGTGFGSVLSPLLWIMGTIFIWRETKEERAARLTQNNADAVTCPSCGYNLTGLSDTRCPECGSKFTLNDLFARQPRREAAKLEQEIIG